MSEPQYPVAMHMFDLLRILERHGGRGQAVNVIAEELGVHRRTIIRYLKALNASVDNDRGEPIVRRESRDGVAWAVMHAPQSRLSAGIYQYAAVFAATRHLTGDSLLRESASAVLDRLGKDKSIPADLVERVASTFHYVPWGPKNYGPDTDVLDTIIRGALYRRPIDVRYRKPGHEKATRRQLEPWTVVMYRDGLYVLARAADGGPTARLSLFAVDRFEAADLIRDQHFEMPAEFDVDAYFSGTLGLWQTDDPLRLVQLAFTQEAAWVARERRWPGFVSWTQAGDRDVLELRIPVTVEVISWATAWGPGLEVLAPQSLRQAVAGRHAAALAQYQQPSDAGS